MPHFKYNLMLQNTQTALDHIEKQMEVNANIPQKKFTEHFGYVCSYPPKADIFSESDYIEFVNKSIEDNFDYIIEKCDTKPMLGLDMPEIIELKTNIKLLDKNEQT